MRHGKPDGINPVEEEPVRMVMQSVAWAQGIGGGSSGSSSGTLLSLVPFVLIFVIFYFLLILPQQKRQKQQKALLAALKKGDKVITGSGIWGTVTNLGKETVTLQIADSAKIRIQREHIARLRADDEDKDKDS
jgi:preprotein translocase subunit YajC